MDFRIGKETDGTSVLDFLRREMRLSRAMLRHLKFTDDGITVDGDHVTVRHILREGELLSIKSEDTEPSASIEPCDIELSVAYEDSVLTVPDKPPFMPTHPSHNHYDDTVANALAFRYRDEDIPFVFRPVNRLDRNTSGLLLIARNRMAAARLFESMKRGEIFKEYLAVLDGVLPKSSGEIETYMKRTDQSIIVRRVCGSDEGGDYALTRYRVLFCDGAHSVVAATPVTGRTHQLRVHFASLGAPICGDDMYGEASPLIDRHALHAARLSFVHPDSEKRMELVSHIPKDIKELIYALFAKDKEKIDLRLAEFYGITEEKKDE